MMHQGKFCSTLLYTRPETEKNHLLPNDRQSYGSSCDQQQRRGAYCGIVRISSSVSLTPVIGSYAPPKTAARISGLVLVGWVHRPSGLATRLRTTQNPHDGTA